MIETIAKYDKRQRISIALLGMAVLALICYELIIRTPVLRVSSVILFGSSCRDNARPRGNVLWILGPRSAIIAGRL